MKGKCLYCMLLGITPQGKCNFGYGCLTSRFGFIPFPRAPKMALDMRINLLSWQEIPPFEMNLSNIFEHLCMYSFDSVGLADETLAVVNSTLKLRTTIFNNHGEETKL
jgi:hypothetical protein